jgi:hypothetical protein
MAAAHFMRTRESAMSSMPVTEFRMEGIAAVKSRKRANSLSALQFCKAEEPHTVAVLIDH